MYIRCLLPALLLFAIGNSVVNAGSDSASATTRVEEVTGVEYDQDEAAGMMVELFNRNQGLEAENKKLAAEVESLQRMLAEARSLLDLRHMDGGQSNKSVEKTDFAVSAGNANELKVLEVNRDMMAAVVSGGLRAGMKVGMNFSVIRDNETLAVIRLIDVRDNIAGGLIEKVEKDRFPIAGDRLVLRTTQD